MALQLSYMPLADQQAGATIRLNMANIVVIEDHPPVLKLLSALCRAEGHEVMAVDNARAGLDAIREMFPDVALVDRRLGEMDGLDMIRDAREASPMTRFVMVSACSETRDIVTAGRAPTDFPPKAHHSVSEAGGIMDAVVSSCGG